MEGREHSEASSLQQWMGLKPPLSRLSKSPTRLQLLPASRFVS